MGTRVRSRWGPWSHRCLRCGCGSAEVLHSQCDMWWLCFSARGGEWVATLTLHRFRFGSFFRFVFQSYPPRWPFPNRRARAKVWAAGHVCLFLKECHIDIDSGWVRANLPYRRPEVGGAFHNLQGLAATRQMNSQNYMTSKKESAYRCQKKSGCAANRNLFCTRRATKNFGGSAADLPRKPPFCGTFRLGRTGDGKVCVVTIACKFALYVYAVDGRLSD